RTRRLILNYSGTISLKIQAPPHVPQPTHSSSLMQRGFRLIVTWIFPVYPATPVTSEQVSSVILVWFFTSDIFGVRMQAAQSSVGKVLSNIAMCPPIEGFRSTR